MLSNPEPKRNEDAPVVFHYPVDNSIQLIRPSHIEPIYLADVIAQRRSTHIFRQLSLVEISKVLWLSAKVQEIAWQSNGYILSRRPSASAGARHPIDILIMSPILDSLKSFHYYNPFAHSLSRLVLSDILIEEFTNHVSSVLDVANATIIWFIAHPDRTEAKYNNAQSLIWKDAGALIHSIQIACAGYNIKSCPVGSLGEPYISQMFKEHGNVFSAGGIVVG